MRGHHRVHHKLGIEELEPRIAPAAVGWGELGVASAWDGGISSNRGDSQQSSVVLGTDGNPIVAWMDNSGGDSEIYVRRWNGLSWVEMGTGSATGGGISDNSATSDRPSLARGADGNPIVAWSDYSSGDREIYARRWDGSAWVELGGSATGGGISNNAGASYQPGLTIDGAGNPVVAWSDSSGGDREIYVRRLN